MLFMDSILLTGLMLICFSGSAFCFIAGQKRYEKWSSGDSDLFTGSAMVFLLFGAVSLICARLGIFSLVTVSLGILIISVGYYYLSIKLFTVPGNYPKLMRNRDALSLLLFLLIMSVILYGLFPTYFLDGGRDHGLYLIFSHHISTTGGLNLDLPWIGKIYNELGDSIRLGYPGIYSAYSRGLSDDPSVMIPQFMHLFPAYGALGHQAGGLEGLVRTNTVIAFFGLWAFLNAGKHVIGLWPSLVVTVLLAVNASMIWVSRSTFTEPLQIFILFLGFHLLYKTYKSRSLLWAVAAGTVFGAGIFNRLDAQLVVFSVFGFSLYASIYRPDLRKAALCLVGGYLLVSSLGLIDGYVHSYPYLLDLGKSLKRLVLANYIFGIGAICLLVFKWRGDWRRLADKILIWSFPAGVAVLFAWIVIRYGFSFRPEADFNLRSVRELGWYVTPVSLLLSIPGLLVYYKERQWFWVLTGGILFSGTLFLYTWKPSITPDHFWASRRWLSFCIPLVLLFGAKGVIAGYRMFIHAKFPKRLSQAIASVPVVWYLSNSFLLSAPFISTSLLSSYPNGYQSLVNKMHKDVHDAVYFTRDGNAASILTYLFNRRTVLVKNSGIDHVKRKKIPNSWGLGLVAEPIISPEKISMESKPSFCGQYTERVRGIRPDKLVSYCRKLDKWYLGESGRKNYDSEIISAINPIFSSQVGIRDAEKKVLYSYGRRGFLQYGPYAKAEPGKYRVTWYGSLWENVSGRIGRVDVVANKGNKVIARKTLYRKKFEGKAGKIASIDFRIDKRINDLEFRFRVERVKVILDKIKIEGISE